MIDRTRGRWIRQGLMAIGLLLWALLAAHCRRAGPAPTPTLAPAFQTLFAVTPIPSPLVLALNRPSVTPLPSLGPTLSVYTRPPLSMPPSFTPAPIPSPSVTPSPSATLTPSDTPTETPIPTPTLTWTPSVTPTPVPTNTPTRVFSLVNKGIRLMTVSQPVLKGQVRDAQGRIVTNGRAQVGVSINGVYRDTEWFRNPQPTNADGWYEIYVSPGQDVRIVEFILDGEEVPLDDTSPVWYAEAREWWYVDIREGLGPFTDDPVVVEVTRWAAETATARPTPTTTPDSAIVFDLVDHGARDITVSNPVVKGQVFDRDGNIITNGRAKVGVTINGEYSSSDEFRNPQPTNVDGWYEIYVSPWQVVQIVRLFIDDREVTLVGAGRYWTAQTRQWWHVDLRQR